MHLRGSSCGLIAIGLSIALFFLGCSDQDSSSTPSQLSQSQAQIQGLAAIESVDGMIAEVDAVATGDLSGVGQRVTFSGVDLSREHSVEALRGDENSFVYDDVEGLWYLVYSVSGPDGSFTLNYAIQFLDASDAPQQYPDDATDEIHYALEIDVDTSGEEDGATWDYDFVYNTAMVISALQTPTYALAGGGSMSGTATGSQDGTEFTFDTNMNWGIDVTVPADGSACPTGTVAVNVADWTIVGTYDASAEFYAWAMFEGENETPIATGFGTRSCSAVVARP